MHPVDTCPPEEDSKFIIRYSIFAYNILPLAYTVMGLKVKGIIRAKET